MSLNRLVRFAVGALVAALLLAFILPFLGVAKSKFLPPPRVYATATGKAVGVVTNSHHQGSNNPFKIGTNVYFIDYQFRAPTPPPRGSTKPGPAQVYKSTIEVPSEFKLAPGTRIPVKYETTYPDINGVTASWGNRNLGPGSAFISGWILFVLLALAFGFGIMMILEYFSAKENI